MFSKYYQPLELGLAGLMSFQIFILIINITELILAVESPSVRGVLIEWRVLLCRAPSVRISRRIKVPSDSISESTGVLNLPTPNGQASGNTTPISDAAELKKFETSVFPPSPPPHESLTSFSGDMVDASSPSIVNHVGNDSSPAKEVRYRKIAIISPGLIFVQKAFFMGLFSGELIFGGAY